MGIDGSRLNLMEIDLEDVDPIHLDRIYGPVVSIRGWESLD
jgi:hypothetical protein